jgi:hypothetical protein
MELDAVGVAGIVATNSDATRADRGNTKLIARPTEFCKADKLVWGT